MSRGFDGAAAAAAGVTAVPGGWLQRGALPLAGTVWAVRQRSTAAGNAAAAAAVAAVEEEGELEEAVDHTMPDQVGVLGLADAGERGVAGVGLQNLVAGGAETAAAVVPAADADADADAGSGAALGDKQQYRRKATTLARLRLVVLWCRARLAIPVDGSLRQIYGLYTGIRRLRQRHVEEKLPSCKIPGLANHGRPRIGLVAAIGVC